MADTLRIAIIGVGGYGINHREMIERLQAEGLTRFVAVADPVAGKDDGLRERLEREGVKWFEDFREMFLAVGKDLDAVVISTPIPLHLPMLEAALDLGLAVFLEKPPVPLLQDFLRLGERPESGRVALGFKLLADPKIWHLKRAILNGDLGKIRLITGTGRWPRLDSYYNRAGWAGRLTWKDMAVLDGPATNALSHIIHNIMFLGADTEEGFSTPASLKAELYRARPTIETYDTCCLGGSWSNGVKFAAAFTHAVEERVDWEILIEGEKGSAYLDGHRLLINGEEVTDINGGDAFYTSWLDFHAMATGAIAKAHTSFADCLAYVLVTNAMFLSSGKIHPIPADIVETFANSLGDRGFNVPGLIEIIGETGRTGRLFSEQEVSWAVPGAEIEVPGLRSLDVAPLLAEPAGS